MSQLAEILDLLEITPRVKERFLRAAMQFSSEDQQNIVQFLIAQLDAMNLMKQKEMKDLKKFFKTKKQEMESLQKDDDLKVIEKNFATL